MIVSVGVDFPNISYEKSCIAGENFLELLQTATSLLVIESKKEWLSIESQPSR